jgi:putative two-component system response regulator
MERANDLLEEKVRERTLELEEARVEIVMRLAMAAEYRDDNTGQHTLRVGRNSALLAQALGLPSDQVELMRSAARLHDVGKIGITDLIMLKPGKLTFDEFERMKTHTTIGATMLSNGQSPLLKMAETIALTHHERFDGTGYPKGLTAGEIPLVGRIVAVADVYDALRCERPYKRAWNIEEARAEIASQAGKHFDARVVDAFLKLLDDGVDLG